MTATDTMRQMFPNQPLPLSLLIECTLSDLLIIMLAFYLDLKAFDMKVGFCPGSILRYNSIIANMPMNVNDANSCNVLHQDVNSLDDASKKYCSYGGEILMNRAFANKYHISRIIYPSQQIAYFPESSFQHEDSELYYQQSYHYREQRTMLHVTSSILHKQSLPVLLSDGRLAFTLLNFSLLNNSLSLLNFSQS